MTQSIYEDLPDPMTEACSRFFTEHWEVASFLFFVFTIAAERDEQAERASSPIGAFQALKSRERLMLELTLCKEVNNFLAYLTELLTSVFIARPEALRSSDKVRIDEVLQFSTVDDIVSYLAERRVLELAYGNIADLAAHFEKVGLELFLESEETKAATRIIQARNLLTHNRGVVNRFFLSKVPGHPCSLGDVLPLVMDQVFLDIDFLAHVVCRVESAAIRKFGLSAMVPRKIHDERMSGMGDLIDRITRSVLNQVANRTQSGTSA